MTLTHVKLKVTTRSTFQMRMFQNGAFYVAQLQIIIHLGLLHPLCNVPLTRGPSAIAEFLVITLVVF